MICVYAGSFDPVTVGHMDIIRRAGSMFDTCIVAVLNNIAKRPVFSVEERMEFIRRASADMPWVRVDAFDGLLVDYLKKADAQVILRGVRTVRDFENEAQAAVINKHLSPDAETVFLYAAPELAHVSSSAVRELAAFGGDYSRMIPQEIFEDVKSGLDRLFA